ncbi:MAG TPA: hypothetical protein VMP08_09160 [Anaerolineae bacterium]|nr:hypothetical protein [Anaerolineae bacterium]
MHNLDSSNALQEPENIYVTWQRLSVWREASHYRMGQHQWLEELLTLPSGDWERAQFDLYMPIAE